MAPNMVAACRTEATDLNPSKDRAMDASLETLAIVGWPFSPGQKVTVRDGDDWKADWRGVVMEVVGIRLDQSGCDANR